MAIHTIHSYLVHPEKGEDTPSSIRGTAIEGKGPLCKMIESIYQTAPVECKYDIAFLPNAKGEHQNDSRDSLMSYLDEPNKQYGQLIAQRLQSVTTHRSGLGLLFLIFGKEGNKLRLVVSRFPADNGILAEEGKGSLSVQFIERIFMKSSTAYKSAIFEGTSTRSDFWTGRAIDKQINSDITISDYWIRDFLHSDFAVTGARGTRRLAVAIRDAMTMSDDMEVKQELAAAAKLAPNLDGRIISASHFASQYHLSPAALAALRRPLKQDRLFEEQFRFTRDEFIQHLAFRSVELDSGAMLSANALQFDDVFERDDIPGTEEVRFSASGRIVNDRLRKSKP